METCKPKLLALGLALQTIQVLGHGYLLQPPARGTAWRLGFPTPVDNTDNEENCGGFSYQWNQQDGKCGICGDPWNGRKVENETPGKYATGTIVSTYSQGQEIDVQVRITANHKGWFEFRLCENNDILQDKDQACFDQHLLRFAGGTENNNVRVYIGEGARIFSYKLKLPHSVTCEQCILQWNYNAGNSWGTDPVTGESCVGCGPQETFRGCSDIKINPGSVGPTQNPPDVTTTSTNPGPTTSKLTTTNAPATTTTQAPSSGGNCKGVAPFTGPTMDTWCNRNCALGNCPASHCECSDGDTDDNTTVQTPTASCYALAPWNTVPNMDQWCITNCAAGNCPPSHCSCP